MTTPVIEVPEFDLNSDSACDHLPRWLRNVAVRTRTLLSESIRHQQSSGALKVHNPSGGVVLVRVVRRGNEEMLSGEANNDPSKVCDFGHSWGGEEAERVFGYYAACKMRPVLRTGQGTAGLLRRDEDDSDDRFDAENLIEVTTLNGAFVVPEGRAFGDFPHKGAVVEFGENYIVYVSISGLSGEQDDRYAKFVAGYVLDELVAAEG